MWAFVSIEKTLLKENLKMYTMNIAYLRINSPQFLISENLFNQFPVFIGQFFKLIPPKFPRCQRVFLQPSSACVLIEILTRVHWGVDRVQQICWKINSNISTLIYCFPVTLYTCGGKLRGVGQTQSRSHNPLLLIPRLSLSFSRFRGRVGEDPGTRLGREKAARIIIQETFSLRFLGENCLCARRCLTTRPVLQFRYSELWTWRGRFSRKPFTWGIWALNTHFRKS